MCVILASRHRNFIETDEDVKFTILIFREQPSPKRIRSPKSCCSHHSNENEIDRESTEAADDVFPASCSPLRTEKSDAGALSVVAPSPAKSSSQHDTEHEVSIAETEAHPPSESEFSVVKDGEKVRSWMCKTCNCLFLNEVRSERSTIQTVYRRCTIILAATFCFKKSKSIEF